MHLVPLVLVLLACSAPFARAQDLLPKAAPQTAPIVLTNGVLHTVSGPIVLGGSLWLQDGVIRAVLAADQRPELPPGAAPRFVDLQGKHVYPGFVSATTSLGLEEIGMVRQTVDVDEVGDLTPEALALTAVNPDTTAMPVAPFTSKFGTAAGSTTGSTFESSKFGMKSTVSFSRSSSNLSATAVMRHSV